MSNSIRKAVFFSIGGNYASLGISFVLMIVVTRWLSPAEIGAFVVALAIISSLDTLRDLNVTSFAVQSEDQTPEIYRSIFGISILSSLVMCLAVASISFGYIHYVGQSNLLPLTFIMALGFLAPPFSTPSIAFLSREMMFMRLSTVRVFSAVARAAVTIGMLTAGFGNLALAWGYVALRLGETFAFVWWPVSDRRLVPSLKDWRAILSFSAKTTSVQMLSSLGMNMTDMATGHFLGLVAAAQYNRGSALVGVYRNGIEAAILPVAYSAFARTQRTSPQDLAKHYLHTLKLLTGFGWPALVVMAVLMRPLIETLFGTEWLPGANAAVIVVLGVAINLLILPASKLLIARGFVGPLARVEIATQLPRIVMIVIAAQFSIEAVASAVVATYVLAVSLNQRLIYRAVNLKFRDIIQASTSAFGVALVTGAAVAATLLLTRNSPAFFQLLVGTAAALLTWVPTACMLRQEAGNEVVLAWRHFCHRLRSF